MGPPVVQGRPSQGQFVRRVVDEMKLRFYERKTIKAYRHAVVSFLRWFGAPPHLATHEDLRHSFATHSFEDGCDIRRIQKALGHVRLETTTIYVKVARPSEKGTPSPLDKLYFIAPNSSAKARPVGRLTIHFQRQACE